MVRRAPLILLAACGGGRLRDAAEPPEAGACELPSFEAAPALQRAATVPTTTDEHGTLVIDEATLGFGARVFGGSAGGQSVVVVQAGTPVGGAETARPEWSGVYLLSADAWPGVVAEAEAPRVSVERTSSFVWHALHTEAAGFTADASHPAEGLAFLLIADDGDDPPPGAFVAVFDSPPGPGTDVRKADHWIAPEVAWDPSPGSGEVQLADLDGDGLDDLFAVSRGAAFVYTAPLPAVASAVGDADAVVGAVDDRPVLEDLDNDGVLDVAQPVDDLGAARPALSVTFGPVAGIADAAAEADVRVVQSADSGFLVDPPLAAVGDVTGDGWNDLAAPTVDEATTPGAGWVHIIDHFTPGTWLLSDYRTRVAVEAWNPDAHRAFTSRAVRSGDVDGDGVDDLGLLDQSVTREGAGRFAVVRGPLTGEVAREPAWTVDFEVAGHEPGLYAVGDVTGDGGADLVFVGPGGFDGEDWVPATLWLFGCGS